MSDDPDGAIAPNESGCANNKDDECVEANARRDHCMTACGLLMPGQSCEAIRKAERRQRLAGIAEVAVFHLLPPVILAVIWAFESPRHAAAIVVAMALLTAALALLQRLAKEDLAAIGLHTISFRAAGATALVVLVLPSPPWLIVMSIATAALLTFWPMAFYAWQARRRFHTDDVRETCNLPCSGCNRQYC
jgi:ABC-type Fe3+-siderophore transport system permease subunit